MESYTNYRPRGRGESKSFLICVGSGAFHPTVGVNKPGKPVLFVQTVSVPRRQQPTPEALHIGLFDDRLHQPFAQTAAPMFLQNVNIADVRERRPVRNHTGKPDLRSSLVDAVAKRILYRRQRLLEGTVAAAQSGFSREKFVNAGDIESPLIGVDLVFALLSSHSSCRRHAAFGRGIQASSGSGISSPQALTRPGARANFSVFRSHGHRKYAHRDRLIRIVEQAIARVENAALVTFRDLNELKQANDVSLDSDVNIVTFQLFEQLRKVGLDQFGIFLDAVAQGPSGSLRNTINIAEEQSHQLPEPFSIVADPVDDPCRLAFRMLSKDLVAQVSLSLAFSA